MTTPTTHDTRDAHHDKRETREERREKNRDILAKEEPIVLESSETDPEFPALEEYEIDEGGAPGSKRKHPGLIWGLIAILAVAVLVAAFVVTGNWFTPTQAERASQVEFDQQVLGEDLGEN